MSKGTKSIAFYVMIIAVFGSLMYLVVKEGESRQVDHAIRSAQEVAPQNMGEGFLVFWNAVSQNIQSPIGILLLQIIAILIVCRIFGWLKQNF